MVQKGGGSIFVYIFALPVWAVAFIAGILCGPFARQHFFIILVALVVSFFALYRKYTWATLVIFGFICGIARTFFGNIIRIPEHTLFTDVRDVCDRVFAVYLENPYRTLISGILFGGTSGFDADWRYIFRATGTMHIVAVSGSNVSFVVRWIEWALNRIPCAPHMRFYIIATGIAIFIFITGAPASVIRAGIMGCIMYFSPLVGRRPSALHALGAAAACMVLINPTVACDVGFQFSCLATLGLIIFEKPEGSFFSVVSETIAATLFVLPLEIFYFHVMSMSALIANIIVTPFVPLLMCLGITTLAAHFFAPFVITPVAYGAYVVAFIFLKTLEFIARIPGSLAQVETGWTVVVAAYSTLIIYSINRVAARCRF